MNAAEIRKVLEDNLFGGCDGQLDESNLRNVLLAEIAAHLAEMNARAQDPAAREQLEIHSVLIKKLIAIGDAMAEELAHFTSAGTMSRASVEEWKAARR